METKLNINGIEVIIKISVDHVERTAIVSMFTSTQNETLELDYTEDIRDYGVSEDLYIKDVTDWAIETRAKEISDYMQSLTLLAVNHNLSQSNTNVCVEYTSLYGEIIIAVWGNFKSGSDKTGNLIDTFICPVMGWNEFDCQGVQGYYDPKTVWSKISKII